MKETRYKEPASWYLLIRNKDGKPRLQMKERELYGKINGGKTVSA